MIKKPTLQQVEILKNGLINKIKSLGVNNAVYSLRDGNINYTLLYCSEGLKLWARYYNYSKCFFIVKKDKCFKELKEVLKDGR